MPSWRSPLPVQGRPTHRARAERAKGAPNHSNSRPSKKPVLPPANAPGEARESARSCRTPFEAIIPRQAPSNSNVATRTCGATTHRAPSAKRPSGRTEGEAHRLHSWPCRVARCRVTHGSQLTGRIGENAETASVRASGDGAHLPACQQAVHAEKEPAIRLHESQQGNGSFCIKRIGRRIFQLPAKRRRPNEQVFAEKPT